MLLVKDLIAQLQQFDPELPVLDSMMLEFTTVRLEPKAYDKVVGEIVRRRPVTRRVGEDAEGGGIYAVKEEVTRVPKIEWAPAVILE